MLTLSRLSFRHTRACVTLVPSKAKTLDLDLLRKPFFGDSHAEAWFIIDKDRAGIQARSNLAFKESLNPFARSCNWYEIVERVTRKAFNKDKNIDEVPR